MDTELSQDQLELQAAMVKLADRYRTPVVGESDFFITSPALETDLVNSGYLDVARTGAYGTFEATMLVDVMAQLPYAIEVACSCLVAPGLGQSSVPRPLALARAPLTEPVRFLPQARGVLVDTGEDVRFVDTADCEIETLETLFAVPLGRFRRVDIKKAAVLKGVSPDQMRRLWQLSLAAESMGSMQAAIDLTVKYLKERRQFGRAIGTFQALQHRISECTSMLESLRVLTQKAAYSGLEADAAMAAFYAQDTIPRVVLDCQQMHGAIGVTLEYPLHYWTYRLKVLQGELGGCFAQAWSTAHFLWGVNRPVNRV